MPEESLKPGPCAELFEHPAHPYTRGLLGSIPTLKTNRSEPLRAIEGAVPSPGSLPPGCSFAPRCPLRIPAMRSRHARTDRSRPGTSRKVHPSDG